MAHHFPLTGWTGGNHSVSLLRLSLQEKYNCGLEGMQTTIRGQVVRKTSGWRESVQLTLVMLSSLSAFGQELAERIHQQNYPNNSYMGGAKVSKKLKKQKTSQSPISNLPFERSWQIGYTWHSCLTWISSSRNKAKSAGPGGWSRAFPLVNQGKG